MSQIMETLFGSFVTLFIFAMTIWGNMFMAIHSGNVSFYFVHTTAHDIYLMKVLMMMTNHSRKHIFD